MVLCWFEIELGVVWGVLGWFGAGFRAVWVVWGHSMDPLYNNISEIYHSDLDHRYPVGLTFIL